MNAFPEGNAIVYCEGAFGTPNGKTAHGLVRRTKRYNILSVLDSKYSNCDAGLVLDNKPKGIFILPNLQAAMDAAHKSGASPTHFIIGLAPDGGRLGPEHRKSVIEAIDSGLHVDSGLHDFLSEDREISSLAKEKNVCIRDVRKPPERDKLHFFSGKIEQVTSFRIAVLGTDSAIGKRTTAWILAEAFQAKGKKAEIIGTGQTAWMQGVRFSIILDSLVNDFVSGEIEHAVWSAWKDIHPDVIIIEGQGSLMNPAYPGGFEILAAGRPDVIVLQHAPARKDYDGFPGYSIHPLDVQIQAIEILSGKPVAAITINHENLSPEEVPKVCETISKQTGLPVVDPLLNGVKEIIKAFLLSIKH